MSSSSITAVTTSGIQVCSRWRITWRMGSETEQKCQTPAWPSHHPDPSGPLDFGSQEVMPFFFLPQKSGRIQSEAYSAMLTEYLTRTCMESSESSFGFLQSVT